MRQYHGGHQWRRCSKRRLRRIDCCKRNRKSLLCGSVRMGFLRQTGAQASQTSYSCQLSTSSLFAHIKTFRPSSAIDSFLWRATPAAYSLPDAIPFYPGAGLAPSVLSSPNPSGLSAHSPVATSHPCLCPYIQRGAQLQYLGHAGLLQYHAHRRALHRSALSASASLFVRSSEGVDKSAGASTILAVSSGCVVSIAW